MLQPRLQSRHKLTEERPRRIVSGEVGKDVGVTLETARGRVDVVAVFGHGQRDDLDPRVSDPEDHGVGCFGGDQDVCVDGRDGVEQILGAHRLDDATGAVGHGDDSPVAAGDAVGDSRVYGLLGPVEVAEAEMDDSRDQLSGGVDAGGVKGGVGHGSHQSVIVPSRVRAIGR